MTCRMGQGVFELWLTSVQQITSIISSPGRPTTEGADAITTKGGATNKELSFGLFSAGQHKKHQ